MEYSKFEANAMKSIPEIVRKADQEDTLAQEAFIHVATVGQSGDAAFYHREVLKALEDTKRRRIELWAAIGTVGGVRFTDAELEGIRLQLSASLLAIDAVLAKQEGVYKAVLANDRAALDAESAAMLDALRHNLSIHATSNSLELPFLLASAKALRQMSTSIKRANEEARVLKAERVFSCAAVLYLIRYSLTALLSLRRRTGLQR
jgi:hypothetical protein